MLLLDSSVCGLFKWHQLEPENHFFRADPGYGLGVAKALGIELSEDVAQILVSASTGDSELVAAEVPSSR